MFLLFFVVAVFFLVGLIKLGQSSNAAREMQKSQAVGEKIDEVIAQLELLNTETMNSDEAKEKLKALKLIRKKLQLDKRAINEEMTRVRQSHTRNTRKNPIIAPRGKMGMLATVARASRRKDLARDLQPKEVEREHIERALLKCDEVLLKLEMLSTNIR